MIDKNANLYKNRIMILNKESISDKLNTKFELYIVDWNVDFKYMCIKKLEGRIHKEKQGNNKIKTFEKIFCERKNDKIRK